MDEQKERIEEFQKQEKELEAQFKQTRVEVTKLFEATWPACRTTEFREGFFRRLFWEWDNKSAYQIRRWPITEQARVDALRAEGERLKAEFDLAQKEIHKILNAMHGLEWASDVRLFWGFDVADQHARRRAMKEHWSWSGKESWQPWHDYIAQPPTCYDVLAEYILRLDAVAPTEEEKLSHSSPKPNTSSTFIRRKPA